MAFLLLILLVTCDGHYWFASEGQGDEREHREPEMFTEKNEILSAILAIIDGQSVHCSQLLNPVLPENSL